MKKLCKYMKSYENTPLNHIACKKHRFRPALGLKHSFSLVVFQIYGRPAGWTPCVKIMTTYQAMAW